MEYFINSIIGNFGLVDYIVLFFIIFYGLINFLLAFDKEGAAIPIFIFGVLIFGTIIYFNHIPNGYYLAKTIEKNGEVIGKGTYYSKKYVFNLNDERAIVDPTLFIYDNNRSNIFVKTYSNYNGQLVSISFMGNVKLHDEKNKVIQKIDVDY